MLYHIPNLQLSNLSPERRQGGRNICPAGSARGLHGPFLGTDLAQAANEGLWALPHSYFWGHSGPASPTLFLLPTYGPNPLFFVRAHSKLHTRLMA